MPSKEVAAPTTPSVPDLAPTAASTITAQDIAIPTLYMGQGRQTIVEADLAGKGDIYAAFGQDDGDPEVLREADSNEPGILIIPLFMFKSWSYSPNPGSPLETWAFEAQGRPYPDGPPLTDPDPKKRAYLVYNYTLSLPEVNPDMPYKTRFYRSSSGAAQKINTTLSLNSNEPPYKFGWRWTTSTKQKPAPHTIPQLAKEDPLAEEHIAAAKALHDLLIPGLQARQQQDAAAVDSQPTI